MINHAKSLAARGHDVCFIGYPPAPSDLPARVRVIELKSGVEPYRGPYRAIFLALGAMRMKILFLRLIDKLLRARPHAILVQNPPSFPTMIAAWLCARIKHARLIVDWHNYGFTMLALRLGKNHALVRSHEWYEGFAGRLADAHLCVSAAMKEDLKRRWRIDARVLYDRPVEFLPPREKPNDTFVVVCPCGWTADENVGLLLNALDVLHQVGSPRGFRLYLTGDGPMRASYEPRIAQLRESGFEIITGFLPEAEYRDVLRRADVGVSLHTSSSGLDLAMKVVDLYAARTPVWAWDYGECLREQIQGTGIPFRTPVDLAALIEEGVSGRLNLEEMRRSIERKWRETWDEAWESALREMCDGLAQG